MVGDSLIVLVVIGTTIVLMFVFPLVSMSEKSNNVSLLAVQTATTEFVDKVRTTGKLTLEDYDKYIATINSTGNSFDVDIELQFLDENPGVKTTQAEMTKIGENLYYNFYTSQVEQMLNENSIILLKEGDRISMIANRTNIPFDQILLDWIFPTSANGAGDKVAQHAGIVTATGTTRY